MTDPFCALKLGDLSILCIYGPSSVPWWSDFHNGYQTVDVEDESVSSARRTRSHEEDYDQATEKEQEEDKVIDWSRPCKSRRGPSVGKPIAPVAHDSILLPPASSNRREELSDFLTDFLQMVWPKVSRAAKKMMDEKISDAFGAAIQRLPESVSSTVQHTIKFGESAPKILDVHSYRKVTDDSIEVCGHMHWDAAVDMEVNIGPLAVGIDRILVDGVGCVIFRPLMDEAPVLGGFHLFYCNQPQVDIGLKGLGGLAKWSMVDATASKLIQDAFKMMMVLPHRMTQRFAGTKIHDMPEFRCPPPIAVLRVEVLAATDLAGVDFNFTSARTSDPYCRLTVGEATLQTATRYRTLNPSWSDEPPMDFVVFHEQQTLQLEVFDANVVRKDVLLARLPAGHTVQDLQSSHQGTWLPLEAHAKDSEGVHQDSAVQVRCKLLDLRPLLLDEVHLVRSSAALVLGLKLYHLQGVPHELAKGARVRLKAGFGEIVSKPCKVVDPGNVCGFGKKVTKQMLALLKNEVPPKVIAETFKVGIDVVEEVARVVAKEESWFGWDQAHYALLKDAAAPSIELEVQLAGAKSKWLPLCLAAAGPGPCELWDVLERSRCQVQSWEFQHVQCSGSVGIALQLLHCS
eukprot:TRINITY_DN90895_c0_g1_i1.p1 TRINITY_DN90895_c0_g1~~TRINITY_DN90895_c0_g1_i1.p1  ORF type:complete len:628 (-),score=130.08 TRINITY_DN90895_c0_g1_i1:43-1926(-)